MVFSGWLMECDMTALELNEGSIGGLTAALKLVDPPNAR